MAARLIAVGVVLALALAGPLQPLAVAQQAGQAQQPDLFKEAVKKAQEAATDEPRGTDVYDVGAGAMNVVALPGKFAMCGLSGAVGLILLAITMGSAPRATANIVREGCGQKWIVRGNDIRPEKSSLERVRSWDDHDGAAR